MTKLFFSFCIFGDPISKKLYMIIRKTGNYVKKTTFPLQNLKKDFKIHAILRKIDFFLFFLILLLTLPKIPF